MRKISKTYQFSHLGDRQVFFQQFPGFVYPVIDNVFVYRKADGFFKQKPHVVLADEKPCRQGVQG